jgi:23S rRNA (pseudouridine1915-N3)-methyltransferase
VKINIIAVGSLKEPYLRAAEDDYRKRLRPYCTLAVAECPKEKTPPDPSPAEKARALAREGDKLLARVKERDFVIALDVGGDKMPSEKFSDFVARRADGGGAGLSFLIGGAYGLSGKVKETADCLLSFSDFTFTHQMIRLLLLEQLYRAFKIKNNEKYHKR